MACLLYTSRYVVGLFMTDIYDIRMIVVICLMARFALSTTCLLYTSMLPILPQYIIIMIIMRPTVFKSLVMPVVMPTVLLSLIHICNLEIYYSVYLHCYIILCDYRLWWEIYHLLL